jgi:hypothetical protein
MVVFRKKFGQTMPMLITIKGKTNPTITMINCHRPVTASGGSVSTWFEGESVKLIELSTCKT